MIETDARDVLLAASAVAARVASRIFYGVAPAGEAAPYITCGTGTAQRINTLVDGAGGLRNARLQVDCWAASWPSCWQLAGDVVAAICAAPGLQAVLLIEQALPDPETTLCRVLLEFSCWQRRP